MRRARTVENEETPGGDSFLDIVANIVGILVLLVVVVGALAGRHALLPIEAAPGEEIESMVSLRERFAEAMRESQASQHECRELSEAFLATKALIQRREIERNQGVHYVTKLRSELDEARKSLDAKDRKKHEVQNAIAQAQITLDELTEQSIALASVQPNHEVELIAATPTPIVKRHVHRTHIFRLKNNCLTYAPLYEFMALAKPSLATNRKYIRSNRVYPDQRSLGPIEGFVAVVNERYMYETPPQEITRIRVSDAVTTLRSHRSGFKYQVDQLRIDSTPSCNDPPWEESLDVGGSAWLKLSDLNPEKDIVEIAVYEDSFESAQPVIQRFKNLGFQVAKRFLRSENLIGVSPNGTASLIQ